MSTVSYIISNIIEPIIRTVIVSEGPATASENRVTADSNNRITADGNNRVTAGT